MKAISFNFLLFLFSSTLYCQTLYTPGGIIDPVLPTYNFPHVGIGTNVPNCRLTIKSSSDDGNGGLRLIGLNNDRSLFIWQGLNGNDISYIDQLRYSSSQIAINSYGGSVSIGGGNPNIPLFVDGFTLMVHGKTITEEVHVQLEEDWPDYVFNDDYKLLPLVELEKFIEENKHLPNIPSSKEVSEQNGIELGEMNVKLLEKIEELTLHLIELRSELNEVRQELDTLKTQQ